ncbi:MAG: polysaccharide biosynthesis protein [Desulfovibrionaceae bacterium]|nr:polysaccharide biosynthesis protein [Desulfovibrionaceae bacterium]
MFNNLKNVNFYLMVAADAALFGLAFLCAYLLRFDFGLPGPYKTQFLNLIKYAVPVKSALFFAFGMYKGMWRYTSVSDFWRLFRVSLLQSLILVVVVLYRFGFVGFSRSIFIFDWVLTLAFSGGLRLAIRSILSADRGSWREMFRPQALRRNLKNVLIIGAGGMGERISREVAARDGLRLVGFLDDDPAKQGRTIHNHLVIGPVRDLAKVSQRLAVDEIFIAVSEASAGEMRRIVETCKDSGLPYKILPAMGEIMDGKLDIRTLRNVDYLDLLGRSPVSLDAEGISQYITGRCVLVTGCGGSIGSELCRQIARFRPEKIVLVDSGEYNLYRIQMELHWELGLRSYVTVLGSVTDARLMDRVFAEHRPSSVFHAAAYKHVPMIEKNPWQAVQNNVLGSRTVMEAAHAHGAERFVLVSTDKAVRPANVMGASKRVTELMMGLFRDSRTRFMAVRFGNVVGSSGSVVPLFRRQIERGGPVTVTHPEVSRYFMSISEAAQLILQAGAMGRRNGEIFVLEMGEPIRIADMANDLIRLSGKEPGVDVEIVFTGLREGEKLFEELITEGEGVVRTEHEKIMVLESTDQGPNPALAQDIDRLLKACGSLDPGEVRRALAELVPEYKPRLGP